MPANRDNLSICLKQQQNQVAEARTGKQTMILNLIIDPTKTCKNLITNKEYVRTEKEIIENYYFSIVPKPKTSTSGEEKGKQ